ncbi:DUF2142 domain-containing protein [Slackia isoflavoniconvertens]|uniref:DUF2142 domain-containing protein n=1 Tax=Slackia isoflavoniconvertens TaxID=572010 RepID=A0A3N0I9T9_9ACTN|nr:DUF2142 domain-containing protein [Slackia isoflavoniconvertens]MBB3279992.1 hypothetical protein [Slackia isoflavoniconvertens]RNM33781.1 hypothetical protein DMP05_07845 [Slackia isoflavoniconvertens]
MTLKLGQESSSMQNIVLKLTDFYNSVKDDIPQLFAYLCISIVAIGSAFVGVVFYSVSAIVKSQLLAFFTPSLLLLVLFLFSLFRYRHSYVKLFGLVAIPAVCFFGIFMLPGCIPDEYVHIAQCASLFSRNPSGFDVPSIFSRDTLPASYGGVYLLLTNGANWDSTYFCDRYLGDYFTHLYLIPGLVLLFGKALSINPYISLIAARVVSGLFFVLVSSILIKVMPYGKTAFLVFLLNPILIQQESSCSADAISIIAGLSFVVYVLKLNHDGEFNRTKILILGLLTILLLISKIMYAPLILAFFIFVKRIQNPYLRRVFYTLIPLALLIAAIAIIALYRGAFLPDAFELLRHPLHCIHVVAKSIWELAPFWIETYAGYSLGALSIHVWPVCFWAYLILQFIVLFYSDDLVGSSLSKSDKLILCIASCINAILILLTMRGWSLSAELREDIIIGVQGRYLVPILFPIIMSLTRSDTLNSHGNVLTYSILIMAGILLMDASYVVASFLVGGSLG